jgi:hypothetical protein
MTRTRYLGWMVLARWLVSVGERNRFSVSWILGRVISRNGVRATSPACGRVVADPSEELVGVADGGWCIGVGDELSDPVLDVVEPDGTDRHGGQDGEGEAAQIGIVAVFGRVTTVNPSAGCLFGEVAEADPAGMRVNVGAFEFAGLDGDEEPFGVDTAREVLRPLASGGVAPAGLPRRAAGPMNNSADQRHKHLLPAHGNRFV